MGMRGPRGARGRTAWKRGRPSHVPASADRTTGLAREPVGWAAESGGDHGHGGARSGSPARGRSTVPSTPEPWGGTWPPRAPRPARGVRGTGFRPGCPHPCVPPHVLGGARRDGKARAKGGSPQVVPARSRYRREIRREGSPALTRAAPPRTTRAARIPRIHERLPGEATLSSTIHISPSTWIEGPPAIHTDPRRPSAAPMGVGPRRERRGRRAHRPGLRPPGHSRGMAADNDSEGQGNKS